MGKYLGIIMKILCVKGEYKIYVIPEIKIAYDKFLLYLCRSIMILDQYQLQVTNDYR